MLPEDLFKFGIVVPEVTRTHETLESLEKSTPGMVIARSLEDFYYTVANGKKEHFKKDECKVLSLHLYDSLWFDNKVQKRLLVPADTLFKNVYIPYKGQDLSGKKLLVWRTGGIGDLLFIKPNLSYLKKKYPDCKIYFGCAAGYFPLVNNWVDVIDKLVSLPFTFSLMEECDYHLTFEGVIERCDEAETTNAYELFSKWMGLNLKGEDLQPTIFTKKENNKKVKNILDKLRLKEKDFICAQVRTSSPIRTPSTLVWKNIFIPLLKSGHNIVFTDSPSIYKVMTKFLDQIIPKKFKSQVHNFCEYSTNIDLTISLVNYSKFVIAPDSALIHIAAALKIPVFGIYGPFPGNVRMKFYKNSDWIEPPEKANFCAYGGKGCCLHGHNPCPSNIDKASPCFNNIDFKEATLKINNLLMKKEN